MNTLVTDRLILRKFKEDDFTAVHSYASSIENIIYMLWGPNNEEDTRMFIDLAIKEAEKNPCVNYHYAIVLKDTEKLIGGCNISLEDNQTSLGWIIHSNFWKQGYCFELGRALLDFGFGKLKLHRITARCDDEHYSSYRVMEKIGMRREGVLFEARPANKFSDKKYGDELLYAILRDEWDIQKEISYYNSLPCMFHDFIDVPSLSDGEISIFCNEKAPAVPPKKYMPVYRFNICKEGEVIGWIHIIIGYNDLLYYDGQIAYHVYEKYRGNGYAVQACRLLAPIAKAHHMEKLLITNNVMNIASRRVCEKLDAKLLRVAGMPEWHDLYKDGQRFTNIFEWNVE